MTSTKLFIFCAFAFYFASSTVDAQIKTVSGIVQDAESGAPLPFATVGIENSSIGTTTNTNGKFILSIPIEYDSAKIIISYMGYESYRLNPDKKQAPFVIELSPISITLEEVEVRPWEAWDYVKRAMQKVPDNYPNTAYGTEGYFSTLLTEDDAYLKFSEAVVKTYQPAYGDTAKSQTKLIQARKFKNPASFDFMRERIEKRMAKEERKAKKKGEEYESTDIDEEIAGSSLGTPDDVINADPIRDTAEYLDEDLRHYFDYTVEGYTFMYNQKVVIIGFESNKKYEQQKHKGKIYISMENDAILSIEDHIRILIPDIVRPVAFLFALGFTDPEINLITHYKPVGNKWYLNYYDLQGGMLLKHKKMFKKNDKSHFKIHMSYIVSAIQTEGVQPIPKDERLDRSKDFADQVEEDPVFWSQYKVSRPENVTR